MKKSKVYAPPRNRESKKFNPRKNRDKLYDNTWSTYSRIFLNVNKVCYACGQKSGITDHLVAHKGDEQLFKKRDNHIPLCKPCHDTITALFDRHEVQKYNEKLQWIYDKRVATGTSVVVRVLPKYGDS